MDSARSLFSQSEELKKVVALERSAVQKSSSAAHEISSMVTTTASAARELSSNAEHSNSMVQNAKDSLHILQDLIHKVNGASQTLQSSVTSGLSEIAGVTKTMEEIRDKTKVINEIAFQTKLLAFNASVEAARAGDHGKGFSVVASEMAKLAQESGNAAKLIETILASSVEKTNQQISHVTQELENAASQTVNTIDAVSKKTNEISGTFEKIGELSNNTHYQADEISKATKEQDIGVSQISSALDELNTSSGQLDAMATSNNQSSSSLSSQVEIILSGFQKLAASFKTEFQVQDKPFDFNSAISAHVDWKMKLSRYLSHPDGSLDQKKVCLDNACVLGKWLYGPGEIYKKSHGQIYEDLRLSHAEFHKTAGQVIGYINAGNREEAEKILSAQGTYLKVSEKTINLIQTMKESVEGSSQSLKAAS